MNGKSRIELPSTYEAHLSTTKFDGMWKQLVRFLEKVKRNGHVSGKQSCSWPCL